MPGHSEAILLRIGWRREVPSRRIRPCKISRRTCGVLTAAVKDCGVAVSADSKPLRIVFIPNAFERMPEGR